MRGDSTSSTTETREGSDNQTRTEWHTLTVDETLERLESDPETGLTGEEASARLDRYGPNSLPGPESRPAWKRFLQQFHNVLIYVLLGAAVVTALLGEWIDTWVILAVVVINAVVGYVQEGKAEQALESIRKMLTLQATTYRDSRQMDIEAEELVPGDIVLLESGDRIPADLRLISLNNLKVEESALTGESEAVEKELEPSEAGAVPGDRTCMLFSGTSVVNGRAQGVVVATGSETELGKINRMIGEVEQLETPLLKKIGQFGRTLSAAILVLVVLIFGFGYLFTNYQTEELFLAVISFAVAAIPEGLPPVMTITLAIGVRAMARRNAIIRRLPSVETLGSVTVICSDKTGTLTKNEMTVQSVVTADGIYHVKGVGYTPDGELLKDGEKVEEGSDQALDELLKAVRACNDASLHQNEDGNWEMEGDPTEGALQTLAWKAGLESFTPERIDVIPFESEHRYMATLNEVDGQRIIFMKGAPEKVMEHCSSQRTIESDEPLDPDMWRKHIEREAGEGRRLMGVASLVTEDSTEEITPEMLEEMTFLGLAGIIDPPRDEVIDAIQSCRKAGIQVKMITGDHLGTARAIGEQLGIGEGKEPVSGSDLEQMSDKELSDAAVNHDVFARTSPEHKLRLVTALQGSGMICAMTGDGVNDAPALKRADVGIAMGIKGSEVTKEASDMVLADDNFTSITNAVREGRTIYDNLRKTILFILPTSGAEALVIMIAILLGITLPITPVQILWVNMVTAITLGLALAYEPAEPGVMDRPPQETDTPILQPYLIWRIAFVSVFVCGIILAPSGWLTENGYDLQTVRTIAVNILVTCQLFYLFNCRRIYDPAFDRGFLNNRAIFITCGILTLLQLLFTYLPYMNLWFGTVPLAAGYWIYPLAGGVATFLLVELEKWLISRNRRIRG